MQSPANPTQHKMLADKVSVHYGAFRAIAQVTVPVHAHKITSIIGPSGCGKSTLLRTFNRMNELVPSARVEGQILLEGEDIYARDVDPVAVRRRIGMVFQRPNPFPKPIYDNVAYGIRLGNPRIAKSELDGIVEDSLQGDRRRRRQRLPLAHRVALDHLGRRRRRDAHLVALALAARGGLGDEVLGHERAALNNDTNIEMIEALAQRQREGLIDARIGLAEHGAVDGDGPRGERPTLGARAQLVGNVGDLALDGGLGLGRGLEVPEAAASLEPAARRR